MRFIDPKQAVSHFHIRDGDAVGDFGAGSGFFTEILAAATPNGRVYAFEIQKQLLERIAELARTKHLGNVEVVWSDLEASRGTKLRDGQLDVGVMANVLFQIEDKATALDEVARVVRKGGKLFVLDWTESFAGMGPTGDAIVSEEQAKELVSQHGFSFERIFPAGDHHYGLALRRE